MSRILRYLACLFTLFFVGNALAAGYSCPDYKKYTSCNPGYYLDDCGSYRDGRTVTPTVGNSCNSCPSGYECDGNTRCPYVNEVTITYNLNGGSGSAPSSQTCTPGVSCSLASGATTTFYRAGYVFVGWSTSSTATSGFSSLTFSANDTVYAVWNKCSAGTYKPGSGTQASASCSACTGRTKYSGAGASSCSTVSSGYYTTGCNSSGNNCTGQSQCTGATYCTGGEQKSCPTQTSGWTRGTGTGWTSYTQCNQTRAATDASTYCSAGTLKQNATSATAWGATTVSSALSAKPGAYVNDTTCSQCTANYYCPGGTTTRQSCSSLAGGFYPNSASGSTSAEDCYTNSISGKYVADSKDSSATSCAAGTYKGSHTVYYGNTSSCNECQNYEYSSVGASSCRAVSNGYYATGCDSSGNGCTGRSYCSGAYWCSDGVRHSCPTADSGWTRGTGSYWDTYTDCYEYRDATSISSYCASGQLVRSADSASGYEDTATESIDFEADPGAYLSGSGIARTCSRCPSGYRDGAGADSISYCVGEFTKYGDENTPAMQTGCAERELGTCSPGSCTYTQQYNGTIISDCTPSDCTKPQTCTSASTNYYLDDNDDPERCPDGYPNSAGGSGGVTQCYSDTKSRPWSGSQVNGTTPTNCYSATWGSCRAEDMAACSYVAYANAAGTGDGTIKSGCSSNSDNCTKQVASVTAKSGYFDAGTYCSACPDAYPNSANGNDGGNGACYMSVSGGHYVADAHDTATATCAAGTYKGSHTVYYGDTSSCSACSGQNQYQDATGQSSCKTVGDGYYKVDNTERAQCSGAYWCSGGVRNSCPAETSGWTRGTGTGWSSYSQCYQTKNATSVSSYCSAGQLQQNGASATTWGTATVSTTFQAEPGAYVTGTGANTTCTQCGAGYACPGGTAGREACDGSLEYQNAAGQTSCKTVDDGYYKSSNSAQAQCPANYRDGAAATSQSGCKTSCSAGTYVATKNAACTTITGDRYYGAHSVNYGSLSPTPTSCPSNYTISGTTAADHDAKSDCKISCLAGQRVTTADGACATPSGSWYTAAHTVSAGSTTPTSTVKSCLTNYATPNTSTRTDHDASTDCTISCAAGTRIASANATSCTTPSGNWYVAAHTVRQGSTSSVNSCATDYTISGTAATNHDDVSDCKVTCAAGEYVPTAGGGCKSVGSGYYTSSSQTVAQNATSSRSACSALTGVSVTGGTYSSVSPFNAATTCRYKAPNKTINGCDTVTTNTVSYSGSAWPATTYSVTADPGYYINGSGSASATCTLCQAGYKCTGGTAARDACDAQTEYQDATGQTSCKTVGSGYYKVDNTEQEQCTGAYWCSGGVRNSCPAETSGWTRGTGTGWTTYTQCYQTRAATAASTYCSAGTLKQNATSATAWGATTVSSALSAKAGAYVNGTTCSQCTADNYCTGGTAAPDECPTGYPNSAAGASTITQCYSNNKSRPWTGSQNKCSTPSGCATSTCNACSKPACNYVAYANNAGTGDGTIKSGCSTNNESCNQTVASVTANAGYRVNGTACAICTGATYSAGGTATTCSTCPSIYTDNTTSGKKAATECQVITDGGYYIAANNDAAQTECPGANYCPSATVNYGSHNSPTACPVATEHVRTSYPDDYYDPTFVRITNQNWSKKLDAITDCSANYTLTNDRGTFSVESVHYDATTEEYSSGGSKYYTKVNPGHYVQNRLSATYCDTGTNMLYKDAEPCPANSYCPGMTSMPACSSGEYTETNGINSCPANYGTSPAMSDAATDCYLTTTAKNFVATPNAAQTTCTVGGYCVGGVKVNYGSTGGRTPAAKGYYVSTTGATTQTPCAAGTYTSTTGQTKCTDAAAGTYTTGCQITSNNTACTGTSVCATNKYSNARASVCISCNTADGYGNSGTTAASHAGQASCKVTCSGGEYVPTAGGGCVNVGVGYWGAGGTVSETATLARNSCESGLTTIGSGAGADEAGDCGRVLNIGSQKIYLRSDKKTDRALNVDINGNVFYGNMSTTIDGPLKINYNGTTYSVYDDSME